MWLCEIACYVCGRVDFYFLFYINLEGKGVSVGLRQSSEYNTIGIKDRVDIWYILQNTVVPTPHVKVHYIKLLTT